MNFKILTTSRWRIALLLVKLGLLALAIASSKVFAEPIDSPFPP